MSNESLILDSLNTLVCKADGDGHFTYLNKYWTTCLGWPLDELYKAPFFDFIHPDDITSTKAVLSEIVNENKSISGFRNRYRNTEGQYIWLEWSSRMSSSSEVFASALPISEKVRLEKIDEKQQSLLTQAESLASMGHWSFDIHTQTLYWSDGIYRIHGIDKTQFELTLDSAIGFYHPDDVSVIQDLVKKAIQEGQGWEVKLRILRPSGEIRYVQSKGQSQRDERGGIVSIFGIFQDITETKTLIDELAEQTRELEITNLRLTESIKAGRVGIWDWDVVNNVLEWDAQMYRIYGLSPSIQPDTVSLWEDALFNDDKIFAIQALADALEGKKEYDIEFRIVTPLGHIRHIKGDATVIRNEAGQPLRVMGTNLDITERYEAQEKINRLKKRNQALLDFSPVCHKIIDLDFKLRYMNRNGFNMLSLPVNEDWYGRTYPFSFFPKAAIVQMEEKLHWVASHKEKISFEAFACDSKGGGVWLYHTIIPILKDKSNELDYLTVVSADITQQKKMQDSLKQREKMDAIGQLAGGIAHDFNNHLASIGGFTELLDLKLDDPELKRITKRILSATENSKHLTSKLLTFSRQNNMTLESIDVHEQIYEILGILSHSVDKRIEMCTDLSAKDFYIMGDKSLLQNALLNIVLNAKDAMLNGGRLNISSANISKTKVEKSSKKCIKIEISDTGIGISESDIAKIYEPFFTNKDIGQGTGLGLSTTYSAIAQLNGTINVESQLDKGTTFSIELPVIESIHPHEEIKNTLTEISHECSKKIMIVDDEPLIREMLRDLLDMIGYESIFAENGQIALDIYSQQEKSIDLVVLDMNMPEMGGMETFHLLKSINPDVKVIVSSGYNAEYSESDLKINGVAAIVNKPYQLTDFAKTIDGILNPVD